MRLTVATFRNQHQFDRWIAKYQYEGTEMWEQEVPLLPDREIKVKPCDLECEIPLTSSVEINRGRANYNPDRLTEIERAVPLSHSEEGSCVLCRVAGKTMTIAGPVPNKVMYVISRDGAKVRKNGREIPGVFMPCVCS